MPGLWVAAALLCALPARADETPFGRWLTGDKEGVIEIIPCGRAFCGRIVGMAERTRADGSVPKDPQGHPQCGLVILPETEPIEPNLWRGRITNPDNGSVWRCELWREGNVLHLRGYVLLPVLGATQDWTPYRGNIGPQCFMG